jgi:cytochrome P450
MSRQTIPFQKQQTDLDLRVAGAHTTSGTLTLLFFHLFHNPHVLKKLVDELDRELPLLRETGVPYTMNQLEKNLVYEMACVRENFRMSPVFTMALPRVVTEPQGIDIDGFHVPAKVCTHFESHVRVLTFHQTGVAVTNHALHHNPKIWGDNHAVFDPERWMGKDSGDYAALLMPFGMGHRSCIGRNIAMINILKVASTLLRNYEFDLLDREESLELLHGGVAEKRGPLMCKVKMRH